MTKTQIKERQRLLNFGGYNCGKVDGIAGAKTQAAEKAWQAESLKIKNEIGECDQRSEKYILTLIPKAQKAARQWLKIAQATARASGLEVKIICGLRTYEKQNALYKNGGVTKAKGGQSWHNFGLAWDFGVFNSIGAYFGSHTLYSTCGKLARDIQGLTWGGDWKGFVDRPHIQLNLFKTTAEARKIFEKS